MYLEAQLVFQHYKPEDDYSNLMFLSMNTMGTPFVYVLNNLNKTGAEGHIEMNGFPVKPWIIDEGNPNLSDSKKILATPEQIGWMDDGDDSDELYDIELKNINKILSDYDGWILIETDDDEFPILYDDKVTIRYADIEDEYEIDEDADDVDDDDDYNNIF
jgi:hypothetical protein